MINQIGRHLQFPEVYLSRTWQNFQENPIDSKIRQVAKGIFAAIYFISFPFVWTISMLGKFISSEEVPDAISVISSDGDPEFVDATLELNDIDLIDIDPIDNRTEDNPVFNWEVEFNFHPDAMKIVPRPITVPENLESDLSYLEGHCLQRAKNQEEVRRLKHMFNFTRRNDSLPRQNACLYFKAIEQKIRDQDAKLSQDDIDTFFMEVIAGSEKCEPTWYVAAQKAYEKAETGSDKEQNLLRLVQEYKETLFMDPTILPEQLKNADWNVINCARILFGADYGLETAENSMMDIGYMLEDGEGTRLPPLQIMQSDAVNLEMRIRAKLEDTESIIEWIKNKVNLETPHLYYDFINGLTQKYHLSIGTEKFFDENYSLTREAIILMLVDIGVLEKKNQ